MECCEDKNINCKNYENLCLNCGFIDSFMIINMLMKYLLKITI